MFIGVFRNSIGSIPNSAIPSTPAQGISNIGAAITPRDRAASQIRRDRSRDGLDSIRRAPEPPILTMRAVNGAFHGPGKTLGIAGRSHATPATDRVAAIL
jgi:hypothetical protein